MSQHQNWPDLSLKVGKRVSLWLAVLAVMVGFTPLTAYAEQRNQIRFPTSDELLSTLERAEQLLVDKKYDEALDLYMRVLEADRKNEKEQNRLVEVEPEPRVVEIKRGEQTARYTLWVLIKKTTEEKKFDIPGPLRVPRIRPTTKFKPRRFRGLTRYIQNRLLALPDEVISAYQERFDYRAKAALAEALKSRDLAKLEGVYQQYVLSQYAVQALETLAEHNLEVGLASDAARLFESLAERHKWFIDKASRRKALKRAVLAYAMSGDVNAVNRILKVLGKQTSPNDFVFGKQTLSVARLLEIAAATRSASEKKKSEGLLQLLGNVGHTNSYAAAMGIGKPRFEMVPFSRARSYSEPLYRRSNYRRKNKNTTHPVIIQATRRRMDLNGDFVKTVEPCALLSTGSQVVTTWLTDGVPGPKVYSPTRENYDKFNEKLLHGGACSHGVFVTSFVMRVKDRQSFRQIPITVDQPIRKLCALDTKRWRWIWNHEDILRKTRFKNASFPAPPIIVNDTVYASAILIEGFVQSYVMAFDLKTGALKWATWVCSGQVEQTMFGEHAREPLAQSVCHQDGKIFHSSSLGAVACLDARTGIPDWVTTYDQVAIKPPKGFYPQERVLGWSNTPPVAVDSTVVVTPLDSDRCVAYDQVTGRQKWEVRRVQKYSAGGYLEQLIGVADGKVILAAKSKIQIIGLHSGRILSTHSLTSQITGRGVIADKQLCLIVTGGTQRLRSYSSQLAVFDLRNIKGGLLNLSRTDPFKRNPGGDLFLFDDFVVVLKAGQISSYVNRVPPKPKKSGQQQDF